MTKERQQNSTTYPIAFLMVDQFDHVTGLAGLAPAVTLSKNGGAFGGALGAVAEIGNGWYTLGGNAVDRNTLGELLIHATAAGADPFDDKYFIVDYDPFADAGEICWAHTPRTLTMTAAAIVAALSGNDVNIQRGDTLDLSITGLGDISDRDMLWFSVKTKPRDSDDNAIIRIEETAGLQRINGQTAAAAGFVAGDGVITVDDPVAGDITITLEADVTAVLSADQPCLYDVQVLRKTGEVNTLTEGALDVNADITRATG